MVLGGPQHTLRKGQHGSGRAGVSGGTEVELSEVQGTVSQEHWSTSSLKGLWGPQGLLSSMSTLKKVIYA